MRVRDDYRGLSGQERAAILVLTVGEEVASKVLPLMDEEEIRDLSQTMANLGNVSSDIVERLIIDFTEQMSSTGSLTGSYESTERLLTRILDEGQVESIMEEIRGPAGRTMWDKLNNVNEEVLATYLKSEYPQTVSVVLSKIRPDHAAKVLGVLPESFAMEVVMRMLRMEAVQKEILDDVERTLRTEFMSNLARSNRRDAHEMMADIFNAFDRSTEERFMDALEERSKDAAEKIKSLMFTFQDLSKLDTSGVQTVIRHAEKERLAIGLKGASEDLKTLFFSNMSERASRIMKEDMEAMGPVRLRDVDEAQAYIVQIAKDLAERGEITIADTGGEDELVY
ncbi:MAG: flagellar motor switch protein FliG [Alphaproteobacteria bacterium]